MTKKDYIALAAAIRAPMDLHQCVEDISHEMFEPIREAATNIANYCEQENPRGFNRHEFIRNCGLEK